MTQHALHRLPDLRIDRCALVELRTRLVQQIAHADFATQGLFRCCRAERVGEECQRGARIGTLALGDACLLARFMRLP